MDGIEDIAAANQEAAPASEPSSLSEAFAMYNAQNRAGSQGDVAGQDGAQASGAPAAEPGAGEPDESGAPVDGGEAPAPDLGGAGAGGAGDGGSPDVVEPVDYNPARENVLKQVQNLALQAARKKFADNNIHEFSIDQLYEQDPNTGRVTFKNPDDPNSPFTSRADAQKWVDAMNKQILQAFRREVNEQQKEQMKSAAPTLRLLEFGPKYDAMDEKTQAVFNALAEPYAIKSNGQVIGFSVDLNQLGNQAKQIAKMIPDQQQPAAGEGQQESPQKTPPLDMKTGAGKSEDEKEPTTLGEALKMIDKQKHQKKEGK